MIAVVRIIICWRSALGYRLVRCLFLATLAGLPPIVSAQTGSDAPDADATQATSAAISAASEQPSATYELLHILNQLNEIKAELKLLRNSVEEMEFANQTSKRRLDDSFLDIDRRLLDLENAQIALDMQHADVQQNDLQHAAESEIQTESARVVVIPDGTMPVSGDMEFGSLGQMPAQDDEQQFLEGTNIVTLEQQDLYDQAFDLLKKSLYEDAIQGFQQVVDAWPSSQLADDAYYWMSEALYLNREFEQALGGFKIISEQYPDSNRLPEAMLKIGYIYYDVGEYTSAAETFRTVLERFPEHSVSISAQTRLRRIEQSIQ